MDEATKVPAETMQLAKVKSGYDQSKIQYELAKYEEEHATLVAPFDGTVANLFAKRAQYSFDCRCVLYHCRYTGNGSRLYSARE